MWIEILSIRSENLRTQNDGDGVKKQKKAFLLGNLAFCIMIGYAQESKESSSDTSVTG